MLVLHVVPFDMMTTPLWLLLFFVAVSGARAFVRELRAGRAAAVLALSAAAALLWPASCVNQVQSWGAAMQSVYALAERAQRGCDARGICPTIEELCGGPDCGSGGTTVRHALRYRTTEGRLRFLVSARLHIDTYVNAHGGVGKQITRETITNGASAGGQRDAGVTNP